MERNKGKKECDEIEDIAVTRTRERKMETYQGGKQGGAAGGGGAGMADTRCEIRRLETECNSKDGNIG